MNKVDTNWLELNRQIIKGKSNGKIIWQPRIYCWMDDKRFLGEKLPEPFTGLDKPDIYKELGCSNRCYEYNGCVQHIPDPRIKNYSKKLDELHTEYVTETPVGTLTTVLRTNTSNPGVFQSKWAVTCEEDMKVMMWIQEHTDYKWNQEHYDNMYKKWGTLGLPSLYVPRVNMQHLFIDIMGVTESIYALTDYPNIVEKYFTALHENHERFLKVLADSPIEWVNYGDNIHSGVLSPQLFEKYVLPAYLEREKIMRPAGKFTFAHWDGDCKPLLKYAKTCGLDGIEAITPLPQGDVTLEEMKEGLGDEITLIDGIAAVLFEPTFPVEQLIEQTKKVIDLFAPNLILGISDEMPSNGDIERVRLVGEIVNEYNSKL